MFFFKFKDYKSNNILFLWSHPLTTKSTESYKIYYADRKDGNILDLWYHALTTRPPSLMKIECEQISDHFCDVIFK